MMEKIPIEIVMRDILVRLPTKDVVRLSCVSKHWRRIVRDPSFRRLHGAEHVARPSESEPLLVSQNHEPGRYEEASVFNLCSGKAMCHVTIPTGYSLANVCNGFLCFAVSHDQAPALVCNPVTGEMLELPKAPPIVKMKHLFALGFSPPTREYKMFRLSSPFYSSSYVHHHQIYITVHTLGGIGGWRQYSYTSRFCPVSSSPPVHIDGKLYVVTNDYQQRESTAEMFVVLDVATEARRTYRLPYYYAGYNKAWTEMLASGFDLNGEMCFAVNVFGSGNPHRTLQFWIMKPPGELEDEDYDKLYWDLRYSFNVDDGYVFYRERAAWLDHTQMLCYRDGDNLYKHSTRVYSSSSPNVALSFDQILELPMTPYLSWNIPEGYRPSLLSPLIFAVPPSQDEGEKRQYEHALLCALRQS